MGTLRASAAEDDTKKKNEKKIEPTDEQLRVILKENNMVSNLFLTSHSKNSFIQLNSLSIMMFTLIIHSFSLVREQVHQFTE